MNININHKYMATIYEDEDWFDEEDNSESNFDCTCGAWKWSQKEQKFIHCSDCICGSSEPF